MIYITRTLGGPRGMFLVCLRLVHFKHERCTPGYEVNTYYRGIQQVSLSQFT